MSKIIQTDTQKYKSYDFNAINPSGDNIRFVLHRYISGGGNRYTCPRCGRRKCFTRYIDTETGEYLSDDCGKCNHESSCGYHYTPRQFFSDHPECKVKDNFPTRYINGAPVLLKRQPPKVIAIPEYHQTEFYPLSWAEKAVYRPSTFKEWFMMLPYEEQVKADVLMMYYVGATQKDVIVDGVNHGPAAVFCMIDEKQRLHDAKMIAYNADGHRVEGWGNSMRAVCERTKRGPQLQWTEKVLFGLHLLPRYPDKVCCIVESEKTALVCACRYPQYLWLATGGCSNLQAEKLKPLMDRKLIVYPDSGELEKWKDKMRASGHKDYRVVEFLENYEPNTDIADVILGLAQPKPF